MRELGKKVVCVKIDEREENPVRVKGLGSAKGWIIFEKATGKRPWGSNEDKEGKRQDRGAVRDGNLGSSGVY